MEVKVKIIGAPKAPPGFESQKEVRVNFSGDSVRDLLRHFLSVMDSETQGIFPSEEGDLSPDLAIIVNGLVVSDSNRFNLRLKEGDFVELVSSPG